MLLLLAGSTVCAQQRFCNNNLFTPAEFNNKYAQLSKQQGDKFKLNYCNDVMFKKCLTSAQVKQIALLFNGEGNRLQFAVEAFKHTADPENFYDVYDAFKNFSTTLKLNDILHNSPIRPPVSEEGDNSSQPPQPQLNLPDYNSYKGTKGCPMPIADRDLQMILPNINDPQATDAQKSQALLSFMSKNCLSMGQLMMVSMNLKMELNRLNFMKDAFLKVYDMGNYNYAVEVFEHEPYRKEWMAYCESKLMPPPPPPPPPVVECKVTDTDFQQIKNAINKESSSNVKITLTKEILAAKKCFTCKQVKEIVQLMSFESGKLEIAKYAYEFTTDKENYYTVADAFSFSSSKEDLMIFIQNKK